VTVDGKETEITKIGTIEGEFEVYHILNVGSHHNYFANGILVHNWSAAPPGCFVAGTEVLMSDGSKKVIESVKEGESVLSYNLDSKQNQAGLVGKIKTHKVDSIIRLTLDNAIVINTTHEHPFYVEGKGWVEASKLQELDNCIKSDGSLAIISTVEVINERHTVYNLLDVSDQHNFYVNDILVHNKPV